MIFCFGELLLRMSPSLGLEWIRENRMPVFVGGAELNVATALINWQLPASYCTALPESYLSEEIITYIKSKGINTNPIIQSGNRIGIYYLPQGADLKNAGVIYDRANSSFWDLKPGTVDWKKKLAGSTWFHFSAISPALNKDSAAVCLEAAKAASELGLTVSIDLNYRAKLWQYGVSPLDIMPGLAKYCNVIMGNIWAANSLLGIPIHGELLEEPGQEQYLEHARLTAAAIMKNFPACSTVANTFRFDEGKGIHYYTSLDIKDGQYVSPVFRTSEVKDKVGSGDCFMGGLIYGLYNGHPAGDVISYAAAAAFGKLQETGDASRQTVSDVQKILEQYGQN